MFRFFNKKGQNTVEYAIVFALVIAAVMAMQAYIRRGLQRGYVWQIDTLNDGATGVGAQYEPYYLQSYTISTTEYDTANPDREVLQSRGQFDQFLGERTTTREGSEVIGQIQ